MNGLFGEGDFQTPINLHRKAHARIPPPFRSSHFALRFFRCGGLRLPARLKGQGLSLPCFLSGRHRNNATLHFLKNQSLKFQKFFRRPEIFFQQKFFQNLQTNSIFKPYIFFSPGYTIFIHKGSFH